MPVPPRETLRIEDIDAMTDEELGLDEMFEDDPRAVNEKEYGKVYHKETIIADRVNVLDTID